MEYLRTQLTLCYELLHRMLLFLFREPNQNYINKSALWAAVIGSFAIAVAWFQLSRLKKISRADFLLKFNDNFFTKETRDLLVLLFCSAIEYDVLPIKEGNSKIDELPYFRIKQGVLNQLRNNGLISLEPWRKGYNAFDIDDLLLGHFDDVGRYERKGLLDFDIAYKTFGYYIWELLGDDSGSSEADISKLPVRGYMSHPDNQGNWKDLEYIHKQFLSFKSVEDCWYKRYFWRIWHLIKKHIKINIFLTVKQ